MNGVGLVPLSDAHEANIFGGKASALARLIAAGLPVPDGLVVPTHLTNGRLDRVVDRILAWAAGRAPYGLVARSSATVEDGATSSYAGVFSSRFTPVDHEALLNALRRVRSSASSPMARAYANARDVEDDPPMAVLIQSALRPYAAGVLVAEVDDGSCVRWRIEAVHGLAEPLVSGRQTGEIHSSDLDDRSDAGIDQLVMCVPAGAGELRLPPGEWISLAALGGLSVRAKLQTSQDGLLQVYRPTEWVSTPVLTRTQRNGLLRLAAAAANALKLKSIDMEWALTPDDDLHLLQARPLTASIPDVHDVRPYTDDTTWDGIPGAPGIGAGPVLQLEGDTAQTHLPAAANGSVIVCEQLGPEATRMLLAGPAAIAATTGGPLSHAAIVARELAIPCVTAVPSAITALMPGTYVSVDGVAGTVGLAGMPSTQPGNVRPALRSVAVLTHRVPADMSNDGRAATLILDDTDVIGTQANQNDLNAPVNSGSVAPVGVLRPSTRSGFGFIPAGYHERFLPDLGWLLWPYGQSDPPDRIVVLGPDGDVLHQRCV